MAKVKYSDHVETLIALVTHLGMTRYKSRTPSKIAESLDLDQQEVIFILEHFRGLFRKSKNTSSSGEHFYTLQLRYARRWLAQEPQEGEEDPEPVEPINSDSLTALLNYILEMVEQEQTTTRQSSSNKIVIIASVIAAISALCGACIGLIGILITVLN